jgi:DNA-binding MarR family transcriptional regulator
MSREETVRRIGELVREGQTLTDAIDDLACAIGGINRTDARALDLAMLRGRVAAGEIARGAGLTSGGATAALDRLERAGLVRRVPDPDDRRRVLIEPTPRAFAGAEELYGELARDGAALFERYSDAELATILDFVERGKELQEAQLERLRRRRDAGDAQ